MLDEGNAEAEVGLPADVLQVITGSGGLIGDALAGHSGVDGIVLTGGVPTGQAVMAKASENLTPVTLELGGKGANVVFPDANLKYCAKAICFGIFMNAGQMCWAGSRLIVHEDVHDELVDAIVAEISKWPVWSRNGRRSQNGKYGSHSHETTFLTCWQRTTRWRNRMRWQCTRQRRRIHGSDRCYRCFI